MTQPANHRETYPGHLTAADSYLAVCLPREELAVAVREIGSDAAIDAVYEAVRVTMDAVFRAQAYDAPRLTEV